MFTCEVIYNGGLRTTAKHTRSGVEIGTDAPVDNLGKGEMFSPTDLVATALATCILTTMAIKADQHQIPLEGTRANATKHMLNNPRRIGKIEVEVTIPAIGLTDAQKTILEHTAHHCPVSKSLGAELIQEISFIYL